MAAAGAANGPDAFVGALEVMLLSNTCFYWEEYHGPGRSPVKHALTGGQLLVDTAEAQAGATKSAISVVGSLKQGD